MAGVTLDRGRALIGKTTFLDRRGAITWPTSKSEGCVSIFGLAEVATMHRTWPLHLLYEAERKTVQQVVATMSAKSLIFGCNLWFADMGGYQNDTILRRHMSKVGGKVEVFDTSEFPPMEDVVVLIDEMGKKGLIWKPESSSLHAEGNRFKSLVTSERQRVEPYVVPAFNNLCQVVFSYELWPYEKKQYGPKKSVKSGEGYR